MHIVDNRLWDNLNEIYFVEKRTCNFHKKAGRIKSHWKPVRPVYAIKSKYSSTNGSLVEQQLELEVLSVGWFSYHMQNMYFYF